MSKELTPLQAFNKITSGGCKGKYHEYCEIVENELKEMEEDKKLLNEQAKSNRYLMEQIKQSKKSLKALEIIKDKFDIDCYIGPKTIKYCISFKNCSNVNELTQEEYDLLKEVLL